MTRRRPPPATSIDAQVLEQDELGELRPVTPPQPQPGRKRAKASAIGEPASPEWLTIGAHEWASDGYVAVRRDYVLPGGAPLWLRDVSAFDLGGLLARAEAAAEWPTEPVPYTEHSYTSEWTGRQVRVFPWGLGGPRQFRPDEMLPREVVATLLFHAEHHVLLLQDGVELSAMHGGATFVIVRHRGEIVALVAGYRDERTERAETDQGASVARGA